jgi:hypothetical protein
MPGIPKIYKTLASLLEKNAASLIQDASNRLVSDTQISAWNAKSTFSGAYTDLSGKPTLGTAAAANTGDFDAAGAAAALISDTAFDATSWDGVTTIAPSKNAVRDQMVLRAPLASPTFTGIITCNIANASSFSILGPDATPGTSLIVGAKLARRWQISANGYNAGTNTYDMQAKALDFPGNFIFSGYSTTCKVILDSTLGNFERQDGSGNALFTVNNLGQIGIGVAPSANYRLYVQPTYTETTGGRMAGFFTANLTPTNNSTASNVSLYGLTQTDNLTSYNYSDIRGLSFATNHRGGGTVTSSSGLQVFAQNTGAGNVTTTYGLYSAIVQSGAGTTGTAYGAFISVPTKTAGVITNLYGLYIGDQSAGATLNYSIYSAGGTMYHSGNAGFGIVPTSKIHGNTSLVAATGNEIAFELDYTVNKASSGNDTGLLIKMTDTASPGTSLMLAGMVASSILWKFDNTGALTTNGGLQTFGANDSAGTGYRYVRVPNA